MQQESSYMCSGQLGGFWHHGLSTIWTQKIGCIIGLMALAASEAYAQNPPIVGRPILFVHGFCADSTSWGVLQTDVVQHMQAIQPALYTESATHTLFYDGQVVRT